MKTKLEKHLVMKVGLLNIAVCSDGTEEEALEYVRTYHNSGTSANWCKIDYDEKPEAKPVKCNDYEGRMHYIFEC